MTSSASRLLVLLVLLQGCQGLRIPDAPPAPAADTWAVSGGSSARTNATGAAVPAALAPVWTYNAEAGFGPASPILAGNAVLVATRRGDLHAIGLERGNRIGYVSMGGSIEGAIALADGAVFGASAIGRRPVFRYSLRAGRTAWRAEAAPVLGGVLVAGGLVVAADAEGRVEAFGTEQGDLRWTFEPDEAGAYRAAPAATPGGVLVADDRGRVRLLDLRAGTPRWTYAAAGPVYGTPAVADSLAYLSSTRGTVEAVRVDDGTRRWLFSLPDTSVRLSAPAVHGGQVAVAATDRRVRLLDARTGAVLWEAELDDAVVAAPLMTRATVFVGTMGEKLIALARSDGRVQGSYELKGRMKSAMAVAGQSVIVLSEPRYVYRFAEPTPPTP